MSEAAIFSQVLIRSCMFGTVGSVNNTRSDVQQAIVFAHRSFKYNDTTTLTGVGDAKVQA
jgi:hypothetical protein